jgi:hypothetical protein
VLRLRGVEDTLRQETRVQGTKVRILQQTLKSHHIPIPLEFDNVTPAPPSRQLSDHSGRDSSASPAVHVDLTSLSGIDGQRVAPVESSIEIPHYHSPSSTAVDSDSAPNAFVYPNSSIGSTPGVTVDLTTLATIGPIKWCGELAAETPPLEYQSPPTDYYQQIVPDINLPAPTLDSQDAIDFVLE